MRVTTPRRPTVVGYLLINLHNRQSCRPILIKVKSIGH